MELPKRVLRARQADFNAWANATAKNLTDVYSRISQKKRDAFERIKVAVREQDGYEPRIIAHTCQTFTVAYLVDRIDRETGEVLNIHLVVVRKSGTTWYEVSDLYDAYLRRKEREVRMRDQRVHCLV